MNDPSLGTNLIRVNPQIFLFSFFHHCLPRIDGPTEVSSVLRDTFPYLTPFPPERFLISFAATTEFWRLPFILLSISSGIIHNIAPYHYIMGTVGFFFLIDICLVQMPIVVFRGECVFPLIHRPFRSTCSTILYVHIYLRETLRVHSVSSLVLSCRYLNLLSATSKWAFVVYNVGKEIEKKKYENVQFTRFQRSR